MDPLPIFENLNGAVVVSVGRGKVLGGNAAACRMFGYSIDELGQLELAGLFDPTALLLARFGEQRAGARGAEVMSCRRADGSQFIGEVHWSTYEHPPRAVWLVADVTDRRTAEARLRSSEARFATIHTRAPFGIALDAIGDGVLASVNDAFCELVQCTRADLIGRTGLDICFGHDEQREAIERALREDGRVRDLRLERRDPGGREHVLALDLERVQVSGSEHVLTTVRDVTERARTLADLRASETRLKLFIENAPAAIAMFDREMRYISASRRWLHDFQLVGDLVGLSHYDVFPDLPEAAKAVHRRTLAGETIECDGDPFTRDDGTIQWLKWRTLPWIAASGEIGGIMIFSEDITRAKADEQASRESDLRKDAFLATLAHELRNPLAPLRAGVEILRMVGDDLRRTRTLDTMDRQLSHLVRLVDDLLDVSRISRGKLLLQRERVALASIIESAVEACLPQIHAGGHAFVLDVIRQPVWLDADPVRMAQVVSNLLNNSARHADRPGCIELRVTVEGDDAVVRVSDQGIGIAADDLSRVFETFTQVGASHAGGLGIGLSLARLLVESHGGQISAESAGVGQGSTFTVRVPRAPEQVTHAAAVEPESQPVGPARSASRRVLVVDDNADAAETLAMLLDFRGCETRVAHDGKTAITTASAFHPEIVFLDIGLPDLTGYEVARRLRADEGSDTILVALTGLGSTSDRMRSDEAGFDVHLTKPADARSIDDVLSRATRSASA